MTVINKTEQGQVVKCGSCSLIHVEFGNISLNLTEEEFHHFKQYVATINGEHFANVNRDSCNHRKILLQIGAKRGYFALHLHELYELRRLLGLECVNVINVQRFVSELPLLLN